MRERRGGNAKYLMSTAQDRQENLVQAQVDENYKEVRELRKQLGKALREISDDLKNKQMKDKDARSTVEIIASWKTDKK